MAYTSAAGVLSHVSAASPVFVETLHGAVTASLRLTFSHVGRVMAVAVTPKSGVCTASVIAGKPGQPTSLTHRVIQGSSHGGTLAVFGYRGGAAATAAASAHIAIIGYS